MTKHFTLKVTDRSMTKQFSLQLSEQEVVALICTIENDRRELSQAEDDALDRIIAALQTHADSLKRYV